MQLERGAIDMASGVIRTYRAKQHDGRAKAEEIITDIGLAEVYSHTFMKEE